MGMSMFGQSPVTQIIGSEGLSRKLRIIVIGGARVEIVGGGC